MMPVELNGNLLKELRGRTCRILSAEGWTQSNLGSALGVSQVMAGNYLHTLPTRYSEPIESNLQEASLSLAEILKSEDVSKWSLNITANDQTFSIHFPLQDKTQAWHLSSYNNIFTISPSPKTSLKKGIWSVETDNCPSCNGLYLDKGELLKLTSNRPLHNITTKYLGVDSDSKLLCPGCGSIMDMESVGGVEIDVCLQCNGVWLDSDELEQLKELDS